MVVDNFYDIIFRSTLSGRILSSLRGALTGYTSMFMLDVVYLIVASIVSMSIGLLVFRWGLNRAIWDGSATSY